MHIFAKTYVLETGRNGPFFFFPALSQINNSNHGIASSSHMLTKLVWRRR